MKQKTKDLIAGLRLHATRDSSPEHRRKVVALYLQRRAADKTGWGRRQEQLAGAMKWHGKRARERGLAVT